jgi:3'-phosphoadenosine 5'-phosphosulfate sulfotransferase (PAPS reductase)/FAD synthetase
MDCDACSSGEILGTTCQICAGGSGRAYHGVYVSFGGGVQSTALAYLCINKDERLVKAVGQLPSLFLFSDTGDESATTYSHIDKVFKDLAAAGFDAQTTYKRKIVSKGVKEKCDLSSTFALGKVEIPAWIEGNSKRVRSFIRRQCTFHWKVEPIEIYAKKYFDVRLRKRRVPPLISQWLGISLDEAQRSRKSTETWRHYVYPLLAMGWTRSDCVNYLSSIGVSATKSACIFCPFRSDQEWSELSEEEINRVAELEETMTKCHQEKIGHVGKLSTLPSFHRSGTPIREKPWKASELGGQFDNDCAGMCGV